MWPGLRGWPGLHAEWLPGHVRATGHVSGTIVGLVGQTAPPVAAQLTLVFVRPVATASVTVAPSAALGPALVTTIV